MKVRYINNMENENDAPLKNIARSLDKIEVKGYNMKFKDLAFSGPNIRIKGGKKMKPKKLEKKLLIKRVTISDLTRNEQIMIRAKGTIKTRGCGATCDAPCDDPTTP